MIHPMLLHKQSMSHIISRHLPSHEVTVSRAPAKVAPLNYTIRCAPLDFAPREGVVPFFLLRLCSAYRRWGAAPPRCDAANDCSGRGLSITISTTPLPYITSQSLSSSAISPHHNSFIHRHRQLHHLLATPLSPSGTLPTGSSRPGWPAPRSAPGSPSLPRSP